MFFSDREYDTLLFTLFFDIGFKYSDFIIYFLRSKTAFRSYGGGTFVQQVMNSNFHHS
jgi:hypothetical protein